MSMRLFNHDDPGHREAFELLPWLASDALVAGERARVEQHVVECMACKRELAALKELQEAIRNEESDVECQRGLGRMMERIDHAESASMPWMRRVARSLPGRFPAAGLLAAWVLVAVLAAQLFRQEAPHVYRVLSAPTQAAMDTPGLVVVFAADQPERHIRELLLRIDARITDGPGPEGAYVLALNRGDLPSALVQLRADRAVVFAEPMPASGARKK
jgi:anti-sigma factor RsiW